VEKWVTARQTNTKNCNCFDSIFPAGNCLYFGGWGGGGVGVVMCLLQPLLSSTPSCGAPCFDKQGSDIN
jgi:hypothetical protein